MTRTAPIFCSGAAHWDIIGHSPAQLGPGADVPGRIRRAPGGVALNIARALAAAGLAPALISVLGTDLPGRELCALLQAEGVRTDHLQRSAAQATDCYVAIEGAHGLVGAIADSAALESLTLRAFEPLRQVDRPIVILDSGLAPALLHNLAAASLLAEADLRLVAAAPAKASALMPFLGRANCCFHVNLAEAGVICGMTFADSASAARGLIARGAARACVTDGPNPATDADAGGLVSMRPPAVRPQRVTGAGDCFAAAHIAAEYRGLSRKLALQAALEAARDHVTTPAP